MKIETDYRGNGTAVIGNKSRNDPAVFTLTNDAGMTIRLMNIGAIVLGIYVPDADGDRKNVVLAYDRIEDYKDDGLYIGGVIGRATNRIAGGHLHIDGRSWQLSRNEITGHHLHGGNEGFNKKAWDVDAYASDRAAASVTLSLKSPDGEEGYPGNITAWVKYTLTNNNEWIVDYKAVSDQPTLVNMTNHSYFNLSGREDILDHTLSVFSDQYSPADEDHIATGESRSVADTPFDLRQDTRLKEVVQHIDTLNYCFEKDKRLRPVARLVHPESGRCLELKSTSPALQVYGGRHLKGDFSPHQGLCLEPQHYPYTPGQPLDPGMILRPGEEYAETSVYRFSVKKFAGADNELIHV